MTDHVSPSRRSEIMRNIKAKNTSPELFVRSLLHRMGYRFRLHIRDLPGCPDIVLPRRRKIIFVHGCFWHRHRSCPNTRTPKSNVDFWTKKFCENVRRDRSTTRALRSRGWRVLVVWECEVRNMERLEAKLANFMDGGKYAIH